MTDDTPTDERRLAERLADESGYPPEEFADKIRELREYHVPVDEIEGSLRRKYDLEKTPEEGGTTVERLVPDGLTPGDAVAVRADHGYIAAGVIGDINEDGDLSGGHWLVSLREPVVWEINGDTADPVKLDYGPNIDYRYDDGLRAGGPDDWDGPSVSLGVGSRRSDAPGEVVLRLPDPVWDGSGVRYYVPRSAGALTAVSNGAIVDPCLLLKPDERPPRTTEVKE